MTALATPRRSRWVLFVLPAVFLAGIVVAYALVESGWRPTTTKNYGELVQPPRAIADVALVDFAGRATKFSAYRGKWALIYFGSAECLKACVDNLYKMRQITAAQGQEAHRVQRMFIVTDATARDLLRYTLVDYPGTDALFGDAAALRAWAEQFRVGAASPFDNSNRIYIVDPNGNFMMSYPPDADPRGMNKDLTLLLRASQIG